MKLNGHHATQAPGFTVTVKVTGFADKSVYVRLWTVSAKTGTELKTKNPNANNIRTRRECFEIPFAKAFLFMSNN